MQYENRQLFRHPAPSVDGTYADPDLYPTLVGLPNLGRITVLSHERDGDQARLSIRCAFEREFSPAVAAVIDPSKLTWVQESVHDLAAGTMRFRLLPDHYADRFSASGRASFSGQGDGCTRTVSGEVKVKAPLVGGRVEKAIVEGLQEYLDAEVKAVEAFLDGRS